MIDDDSKDQLPPHVVMEQLKAHDARMKAQQPDLAESKAMYLTEWWQFMNGGTQTIEQRRHSVQIEVNGLWTNLTGYLAALYPRAIRPVVEADPMGRGDATRAQLVTGKFMTSAGTHFRTMMALRQALLYPSCGAKVGYRPGYGSPLDRVWLRIVPHWEMVLDIDASDTDDERFRGHAYYRPVGEVEEEYGLKDLTGTQRTDFLSARGPDGGSGGGSQVGDPTNLQTRASSDNRGFVRVLELINLVDMYEHPEHPEASSRGRLEIYVLGQGQKYDKPVYSGALPFARASGTPLAHLVPLIFNHEPEFPLRGIAHAKRMLPQGREKNQYRSYFATASRKDARIYLVRKGILSGEQLSALARGDDGLVIEVEETVTVPLSEIVVAVKTEPISGNIKDYMALTDRDAEHVTGQSPNARGIVTKATAFEMEAVQQYTESDYGMHAEVKDGWLGEIARLVLRASMAAMRDSGDSAGAYEPVEAEVGAVGAAPAAHTEGDAEQEHGQDIEAATAEAEHASPVFVDDDKVQGAIGTVRPSADEAVVKEQTIVMEEYGEPIEITADDLDGDFNISYNEEGTSPQNEAQVQTALVKLRADLTELWAGVQKGDVFSLAYMRNLCEKFRLPKDLYPEALLRKQQEQEAKKPKRAPKDAQVLTGASRGAAPTPEAQPLPQAPGAAPPSLPGAPPSELVQVLQRAAALPPQEALAVLAKLAPEDADLQATIQQIAQAPPEQQQALVQALIQQITGGA